MAITVDPFSCIPLHVQAFFDDTPLGDGTGFTVLKGDQRYLITNWHIVSGRDPVTRSSISKDAGIPNRLVVWLHVDGKFGHWNTVQIPLVNDSNNPLWIEREHQASGHMVDVVALPVPTSAGAAFFDLDLGLKDVDVLITPSEPVSIVGFPHGRSSAGKLAIWKTGHVATDLEIDFEQKPVFLIDATTKPGMSGSPVLARRPGSRPTSIGLTIGGGTVTRFLGIYSGRVSDQPADKDNWNLGMVWKVSAIEDLLP